VGDNLLLSQLFLESWSDWLFCGDDHKYCMIAFFNKLKAAIIP